jgi:hypothetical protein
MRLPWQKKKDPRQIFHYWDGAKQRSIDPLVAYRGLQTHSRFNMARHFDELSEEDFAVSDEAAQAIVEAARDVFGVAVWSEDSSGGLPETESVMLVTTFALWLADQKKNTN